MILICAASIGVATELIDSSLLAGLLFVTVTSFLALRLWIRVWSNRDGIGLLQIYLGCFIWYGIEILQMLPVNYEVSSGYSLVQGAEYPAKLICRSILLLGIFLLFATCCWFFSTRFVNAFLSPLSNRNWSHGGREKSLLFDLILLLFAISSWLTINRMLGGTGNLSLDSNLREMSSESGELGLAAYLPIVTITAAGYAGAKLTNRKNWTLLRWLTLLVGFSYCLISATRFKLAFLLCPALFILFANRGFINKAIGVRSVLVLLLASSLIYGFRLQLDNRMEDLSLLAGVGHFSALLDAIVITDNEGLSRQFVELFFVTDSIPRFMWPGKPFHEYWLRYNELVVQGNITPSIVGQYYLNWGFFGVINAGVVFGLICRFADELYRISRRKSDKSLLIVFSFLLVFIFLSFRMMSMNYGNYFLFCCIIYLLENKLIATRSVAGTNKSRKNAR